MELGGGVKQVGNGATLGWCFLLIRWGASVFHVGVYFCLLAFPKVGKGSDIRDVLCSLLKKLGLDRCTSCLFEDNGVNGVCRS